MDLGSANLIFFIIFDDNNHCYYILSEVFITNVILNDFSTTWDISGERNGVEVVVVAASPAFGIEFQTQIRDGIFDSGELAVKWLSWIDAPAWFSRPYRCPIPSLGAAQHLCQCATAVELNELQTTRHEWVCVTDLKELLFVVVLFVVLLMTIARITSKT